MSIKTIGTSYCCRHLLPSVGIIGSSRPIMLLHCVLIDISQIIITCTYWLQHTDTCRAIQWQWCLRWLDAAGDMTSLCFVLDVSDSGLHWLPLPECEAVASVFFSAPGSRATFFRRLLHSSWQSWSFGKLHNQQLVVLLIYQTCSSERCARSSVTFSIDKWQRIEINSVTYRKVKRIKMRSITVMSQHSIQELLYTTHHTTKISVINNLASVTST